MNSNKKKKTSVGLIVGGAIAVILLAVGLIAIPKLLKSPEMRVKEAWLNTFRVSRTADFLINEVDLPKIIKKQLRAGETKQVSFDIENSSVLTSLNETSGQIYSVYAPEKKLVNAGYKFVGSDDDEKSLEIIGDEEMTYVYFPDSIKGYLAFPNKDFYEKFISSEFGKLLASKLGLNYESIEKYAPKDIDYFKAAVMARKVGDIEDDLLTILSEFIESIIYEDGGKEKIVVNGTSMKAEKYYVVVPEEALEELLNSIVELAYKELSSDSEATEDMGISASKLEIYYSQIKTMIPSMVPGDYKLEVYVYENKVVKLVSKETINLFGIAVDYNIDINITDNVSGIVEFDAFGHTIGIDISLDDAFNKSDGTVTIYFDSTEFKFDINVISRDDSQTMTCSAGTVDIKYNKKDIGTFTWDAGFSSKAGTFEKDYSYTLGKHSFAYKATGAYKDIKKGKSYTVDVSDCIISVDGVHIFDGAYVFTDTASVSQVKGIDLTISVHDVTSLSKKDILGLFKDNYMMFFPSIKDAWF